VQSCFVNWATSSFSADAIEKDQLVPYDGIIFNYEKSESLLFNIQKLAVIEEQCSNLTDQVSVLKQSGLNLTSQNENLKQQLDLTNQLLDIEKSRSKLERERAEFYREQNLVKDKILDQTNQLNEKLITESKKKSWWKSLAIAELFVVLGVAIGLAL
jgi:hypothetical protein